MLPISTYPLGGEGGSLVLVNEGVVVRRERAIYRTSQHLAEVILRLGGYAGSDEPVDLARILRPDKDRYRLLRGLTLDPALVSPLRAELEARLFFHDPPTWVPDGGVRFAVLPDLDAMSWSTVLEEVAGLEEQRRRDFFKLVIKEHRSEAPQLCRLSTGPWSPNATSTRRGPAGGETILKRPTLIVRRFDDYAGGVARVRFVSTVDRLLHGTCLVSATTLEGLFPSLARCTTATGCDP